MANDDDSQDSRQEAYREHVEKLHEFFCDEINKRMTGSKSNRDGGTTKGSSDYRNTKENGFVGKCKLPYFAYRPPTSHQCWGGR